MFLDSRHIVEGDFSPFARNTRKYRAFRSIDNRCEISGLGLTPLQVDGALLDNYGLVHGQEAKESAADEAPNVTSIHTSGDEHFAFTEFLISHLLKRQLSDA